ncbi:right-handed parallel beta-helix repeat-containing protein [Candidatus Woesearchaeota archaeon]|nr:right-handed parallel beta-helix repeat-containing protein [Candidatus Woesearchaeota archaeon]
MKLQKSFFHKKFKNKKARNIAILSAFALLAVVLLFFQGHITGQAVQESASRQPLKCGDIITQKTPSPIILTNKDPITQAPCKNKGLTMTGFNKVLDCKGLSITSETNRFIGVEIKSSGNEIRNCKISGFESGIQLTYASKNQIKDIIFEGLSFGIKLTGKSKENSIRNNFFAAEEADIYHESFGKNNKAISNDFFGKKSIDLRTQQTLQVCEGKLGNYLSLSTKEPLQLQAKSSCGISKLPLTTEGKRRMKS